LAPEDFKKEVGKNIRKYREIIGYTQKQFADMIGLRSEKGTTISAIENGKHLFPLEKLPIYLKVLNCNVEDLLTPLFKKEKTDLDLFYEDIRQLWNISEAREDLQYGLELIKRAHQKKISKLLREEGGDRKEAER